MLFGRFHDDSNSLAPRSELQYESNAFIDEFPKLVFVSDGPPRENYVFLFHIAFRKILEELNSRFFP